MAKGIRYDISSGVEEFYEFEEEVIDRTQEIISEKKAYLTSTDWYYSRKMETGEEVPADVVAKRLEARSFIREHETT